MLYSFGYPDWFYIYIIYVSHLLLCTKWLPFRVLDTSVSLSEVEVELGIQVASLWLTTQLCQPALAMFNDIIMYKHNKYQNAEDPPNMHLFSLPFIDQPVEKKTHWK